MRSSLLLHLTVCDDEREEEVKETESMAMDTPPPYTPLNTTTGLSENRASGAAFIEIAAKRVLLCYMLLSYDVRH
jgi:hypothetical protein